MTLSWLMLLSLAVRVAETEGTPATCEVDHHAMLALNVDAFDQDMQGGWRVLARRPECMAAAADLIGVYRGFLQSRLSSLYWHEGQLRASIGQIDEAVTLMEQARKEPFAFGRDHGDWNAYVDATVAFLRNDRVSLLAARERLANFPVPENFTYIDADGETRTGRPSFWPMNLGVVDGLVRCFGRPYREAYGSTECRQPSEQ